MKFSKAIAVALGAVLMTSGLAMAKPTVFPVGTVKYDPAKTWGSFVILSGGPTAKLIDRNGNLVHEWDLKGGGGMPNKVFKGGFLLTSMYPGMNEGYQDGTMVALLDFDGKLIREYSRNQEITKPVKGQVADKDGKFWASRQHHDIQLEGSSTGYYAPDMNVKHDGKMLVLSHRNVKIDKINANVPLLDDVIQLVDKDQKVLWSWAAADHFDELNLDKYPDALKILGAEKHPFFGVGGKGEFRGYDWFHINCASWLGPNQWFDKGDKRFHPDNIIIDSRETGHLAIIDHVSGKIVWQVAPPFIGEDEKVGPFIGPHHTHMIPAGLPGAGNIMVFDNGGSSPYFPAINNYYSRIVEFNPVTKEIVWEYSNSKLVPPFVSWIQHGDNIFFSPFISSAQRLPNGNTLIDEGSTARLIEVTPELEIVWEYISPYNYIPPFKGSVLYRAYAVPYDYVPQLKKPVETAVEPPAFGQIIMPDVNGKLPSITPKKDYRPFSKPEELIPVMTPAYQKATAK